MKFSYQYLIAFVVLLLIEILIAIFLHDPLIRPYIGDVLVVILIYSFIKAFAPTPVRATAVAVLLFAFSIELLQYINLVGCLGLQHANWARIVIGTTFSWQDLLAYTAGFTLILFVEKRKK